MIIGENTRTKNPNTIFLNVPIDLRTVKAGCDLSTHIYDRHTLLSQAADPIVRRERLAAYIHFLR